MNGIVIGLIELLIFFFITFIIKKTSASLKNLDNISYYWLSMTILTGIWETFYIIYNAETVDYAQDLLTNKEHVWFKQYDFSFIFPHKLATIFYAEYGAYADREYMYTQDDWSKIIESTHAICCGIFALIATTLKNERHLNKFNLALGVAMGSQAMNSILYMAQYFIELNTSTSVNYNTPNFPAGDALVKRPFMYVNMFWTIMPIWILTKHFSKNNKYYQARKR